MGSGGMNVVRVGGTGGGMGGGSFGGLNLGSTGNGLTESSQLGFNYRDTWSPKFDITGSYFFNNAQTRNIQSTLRQTIGSTSYITDQQRNSLSENNNHRVNLNLTYRLDSMNSIL